MNRSIVSKWRRLSPSFQRFRDEGVLDRGKVLMYKEVVIGFDCREMWLPNVESWSDERKQELLRTGIVNLPRFSGGNAKRQKH
jgi:hypothetical protein